MFNRQARSHRVLVALGAAAFAGSLLTGTVAAAPPDRDDTIKLHSTSFPTDPRFTQLLGVNDHGIIAGYHGDEGTENTPNKGFTLELPANFSDENFPESAQTQVVGIDNNGDTVGFFIDQAGNTHGFLKPHDKNFRPIDLPGTTFNQLLGINNKGQEAGYFQDAAGLQHAYVREKDGSFLVLNLPMPSSQATSINDEGTVVGFEQTSPAATTSEGYILKDGKLTKLQVEGSTFTQALGVNNDNEVVGTYTDANGTAHGFIWKDGKFKSVDGKDAQATTLNGINNRGEVVGFYMDQNGNTAGLVGNRDS